MTIAATAGLAWSMHFSGAAQSREIAVSEEVRRQLVTKIRELYGPDAPDDITFSSVTVAASTNGGKVAPGVVEVPMILTPGSGVGTHQAAYKGQVATGIAVSEVGDQLFLDVKPCSAVLAVFTQPYRREPTGTIKCGGKELPQETLTQQ
jgi:hypothetical protein